MKYSQHCPKPRRFFKASRTGSIRSFLPSYVLNWFGSTKKCGSDNIFKDIKTSLISTNAVCMQKFILDWKVDNLEFLRLHTEDPLVYGIEGESTSVFIYSQPFIAGHHINRDSEWTLMLKSHHAINGAYYFGVLLFLNRIIHGEGSSSAISASMSLHAIGEHGEIIVSRHLEQVSFRPTATNEERMGHGFYDFISFKMVNDAVVKLFSSQSDAIHLRLELCLPADRPSRVQLVAPIRFFPQQPSHNKFLSFLATDKHICGHSASTIEIIANRKSFHVDPRYLKRFAGLRQLLKEDEVGGNLGIIELHDVPDAAVQAMLRYLVGNHILASENIKEAIETLRLSHKFGIAELAHDMWLNVLRLANLQDLPSIIELVACLNAPKFVKNHIRVLLFTFIFELKNLKDFSEWALAKPLSFLSLFLDIPDLEDESVGLEHDAKHCRVTAYANDNEALQCPISRDSYNAGLSLQKTSQGYLKKLISHFYGQDCASGPHETVRRLCEERLYVDYLNTVKSMEKARRQ